MKDMGEQLRTPSVEPKRPHRIRRGLAGLTALGTMSTGVACAPTPGESKPSSTTIVDLTQPPLTSPETTVITSSPTTTETPTTIPERVFASPEQQAQVEAVEANMADFFELTPNDLELYKNQATFTPYPEGFAPVAQYSDSPSFRVLAVNLGTFTSIGDAGQATIHIFGVIKEDGTRYVMAETLSMTDPEIANEQFSYHAGVREVGVINTIKGSNEYGSTNEATPADSLDRTISMPEAVDILNANSGQPMPLEVSADSAWLVSWGYPTAGNPELKQVVEEVLELGSGDHIRAVLDKYSPEELAAVGILKSSGYIPTEMLFYTSAGQLLSRYPLNQLFGLYNEIPPISHET